MALNRPWWSSGQRSSLAIFKDSHPALPQVGIPLEVWTNLYGCKIIKYISRSGRSITRVEIWLLRLKLGSLTQSIKLVCGQCLQWAQCKLGVFILKSLQLKLYLQIISYELKTVTEEGLFLFLRMRKKFLYNKYNFKLTQYTVILPYTEFRLA